MHYPAVDMSFAQARPPSLRASGPEASLRDRFCSALQTAKASIIVLAFSLLLAHPMALMAQNCFIEDFGNDIVQEVVKEDGKRIRGSLEESLKKLALGCLIRIPFDFGGFKSLSGLIGGLISSLLRKLMDKVIKQIKDGLCKALDGFTITHTASPVLFPSIAFLAMPARRVDFDTAPKAIKDMEISA
jgi:hypothetical protein